MTNRFLIDEHLPLWWPRAVMHHQPHFQLWRVGDEGAPPLRSLDPVMLAWCDVRDFMLITDNRKTMPVHLAAHLSSGRHVPGILIVDPLLSIHVLIDNLLLIHGACFEYEFRDRYRFLPLV